MPLCPITVTRREILRSLAALSAGVTVSFAQAQGSYPNRPMRLVVSLPAGTSADVMARFIAERLGRALGQPVVVDNRPGASSIIGAQAVASAPADGYTLLYGLAPSISLNPYLYKKLPYKASDFMPIIHLLDVPFVLVVRSDSPHRNAQDLFKAAKESPDKLSYASYGLGSPNHVAMLQMLQATGASMTHVPYKDGGLTDVLGGLVDCSLEVTAMAMQHVEMGKLRPLLVSARTRIEKLPEIRTSQEAGLGAPLYSWNGLFAPAGTPLDVISRLATAMQEITARSDFTQKVLDFTQVPRGGTSANFATFLAEDSRNWGEVVTRANIHID